MRGFPGRGRGGAIQTKAPASCGPSASSSLEAHEWAVGGEGVPMSFPPPSPARAVQHLRDRHGLSTRAHGPIPQQVSQSRIHTDTHSS